MIVKLRRSCPAELFLFAVKTGSSRSVHPPCPKKDSMVRTMSPGGREMVSVDNVDNL